MNLRKYNLLIAIIFGILSIALIGSFQFKIDTLYSYDSYFNEGFLSQISSQQNFSNDIIPSVSTYQTKNPTGYLPMIGLSAYLFSSITNIDPFFSVKVYTTLIFFLGGLLIFLISLKLFNKKIATINYLIFIFSPYLFYRANIFAGENLAIIIFLISIYFVFSKNLTPLIITIPFLISVHPKSSIIFCPLIFFGILFNYKKEMFNKKNMSLLITIFILSLPFLPILFRIFYSYFFIGAVYPLYPEPAYNSFSLVELISFIGIGIFSLVIMNFRELFLNKFKKEFNYFIFIFYVFAIFLLVSSSIFSFPANRMAIYFILLGTLVGGLIINIKIKQLSKLFLIFSVVLIIILSFFHSTWSTPYGGWGDSEKEAMNFLKEKLNSSSNYIIFSPEYSLPFAYGLRNIEFDEYRIAGLLNKSSLVSFKTSLEKEYPFGITNYYIILSSYSCSYLEKKHQMIRLLCEENEGVIFENNKIRILLLEK